MKKSRNILLARLSILNVNFEHTYSLQIFRKFVTFIMYKKGDTDYMARTSIELLKHFSHLKLTITQ